MNALDRGEAVGLTLHIGKRIAYEAKSEHAIERLEEADSPEELRPLLQQVAHGMSDEKQDEYLRFVGENGWDDFKRRLIAAAEHSEVDRMSPSS